jgi:hypothetical protein
MFAPVGHQEPRISTSRAVPDWLSLNKDEFKGVVMRIPTRDEIQPIANEQASSNFIPANLNRRFPVPRGRARLKTIIRAGVGAGIGRRVRLKLLKGTMPVRLGRLKCPSGCQRRSTATETYAKFIAEPFETGYGHTIGNSLRRVLLSSLEGAAITSIKIDGAMHEFATIDGVVEDVTDIVLNLKKVCSRPTPRSADPAALRQQGRRRSPPADIQLNQNLESSIPTSSSARSTRRRSSRWSSRSKVGRGFCPGDENKKPNQPIGVIAIDSLFSPVTRVRYASKRPRRPAHRLRPPDPGIWTDGRISPRTTR